MHVLCSDVQGTEWFNDILLFALCSALPELVSPCLGMTVRMSTDTDTCMAVADALQASSSSHLSHGEDQPGVIGGGLGSAAQVLDRASEGSTSVCADANGLIREQASTAWSDTIENINAGMLLASHHVLNQTNSILMGSCSGSLSAL